MNCIYCHKECESNSIDYFYCLNKCSIEYKLNANSIIYRVCLKAIILKSFYSIYIYPFSFNLDQNDFSKLRIFKNGALIYSSNTLPFISPSNIEEFISNFILL